MKESVQKMNGRKKYVGESCNFYRKNRPIGKGGNCEHVRVRPHERYINLSNYIDQTYH